MAIASFEALKTKKEELRTLIRATKIWKDDNTKFGSENEYSWKSLKGGLDAILTDISTLTQTETTLIKLTTAAERNSLISAITNLNSYISTNDGPNIAGQIDSLKVTLRSYNIRNSELRFRDFIDNTDSLQRQATALSVAIEKTNEALKELNEKIEASDSKREAIESETENLKNEISTIPGTLEEITSKNTEASSILESISKAQREAAESSTTVESLKQSIDSFFQKISQREIQLEQQDQRTKFYEEKLTSFEKERQAAIDKAQNLISKSREALGYTTAQGLSAAFNEQYKDAKNDPSMGWWIISSFAFMVIAIALGLWIAIGANHAPLELVIARLSLIPLCVAGAWFSASQYVKQRNIAEDYAYKSVLAKSLSGFSEQIRESDGETDAHAIYLEKVLGEIHQDPLRSRRQKSGRQEIQLDTDSLKKNLSDMADLLSKLKGKSE